MISYLLAGPNTTFVELLLFYEIIIAGGQEASGKWGNLVSNILYTLFY
jgi:hypothetical protein